MSLRRRARGPRPPAVPVGPFALPPVVTGTLRGTDPTRVGGRVAALPDSEEERAAADVDPVGGLLVQGIHVTYVEAEATVVVLPEGQVLGRPERASPMLLLSPEGAAVLVGELVELGERTARVCGDPRLADAIARKLGIIVEPPS